MLAVISYKNKELNLPNKREILQENKWQKTKELNPLNEEIKSSAIAIQL